MYSEGCRLFENAPRRGSKLAFLNFPCVAAVLTDAHRSVDDLGLVRAQRLLPDEVGHAKGTDRCCTSCYIVHMTTKASALLVGQLTLLH